MPGDSPASPEGAAVTFVADRGWGSMASCSRYLAPQLGVHVLLTSAYEKAAMLEGVGLLDPRSFLGFARDTGFVRVLRRARGRLIHFSNHHLARYGHFLDVPFVVTVHDLIRLRDAELRNGTDPLIRHPTRRDRLLYHLDHEGIRKAAAVVAVSEATRREVVEILGVPPERVFVVHHGIDHVRFRPTARRPLPDPYVLFVGVEHPRKNLESLLRAFAQLKRERQHRGIGLVKVGAAGYRGREFRYRTRRAIEALGLERDVLLVGRVDVEALRAYYSSAQCLVLPSLHEGFGLPALEAMACGCPVIVSNRGALPEVVGTAALVTGPDPDSLAAALGSILRDPELRDLLRTRGRARARRFTWEAAAARTQRVYETLATAPP